MEGPLVNKTVVRMRELRIYINPVGTDSLNEHGVFYSRRADGPYYRWFYEAASGQWCGSRVHLPNLTLRVLALASWQTVPLTLQARLSEHYQE